VFSIVPATGVYISGGDSAMNVKEDFSVHLTSYGVSPYWTPGTTKLNCAVTGFSASTLTFECTPDIPGECYFVVYVRSGLGTGLLGTSESPYLGVLRSTGTSYGTATTTPTIALVS
jgi:hypothetical protein